MKEDLDRDITQGIINWCLRMVIRLKQDMVDLQKLNAAIKMEIYHTMSSFNLGFIVLAHISFGHMECAYCFPQWHKTLRHSSQNGADTNIFVPLRSRDFMCLKTDIFVSSILQWT